MFTQEFTIQHLIEFLCELAPKLLFFTYICLLDTFRRRQFHKKMCQTGVFYIYWGINWSVYYLSVGQVSTQERYCHTEPRGHLEDNVLVFFVFITILEQSHGLGAPLKDVHPGIYYSTPNRVYVTLYPGICYSSPIFFWQ